MYIRRFFFTWSLASMGCGYTRYHTQPQRPLLGTGIFWSLYKPWKVSTQLVLAASIGAIECIGLSGAILISTLDLLDARISGLPKPNSIEYEGNVISMDSRGMRLGKGVDALKEDIFSCS